MTAKEIIAELKAQGAEGYVKILRNHGVTGPCFGVKIEYLKKIQKRVKMDYQLARDLFDTSIYDAQYLAGLIADDLKMTRQDLEHWANLAAGSPLIGHTVPSVAAGSGHAFDLAREWIDSPKDHLQIAGWNIWSLLVAIKPDEELNLAELKKLLKRTEKTLQKQTDDVRYAMNGFVISVGGYVKPLTGDAIATAEKIGKVTVDMGDTACKVPSAPEYIKKIQSMGRLGKKRKSAKC